MKRLQFTGFLLKIKCSRGETGQEVPGREFPGTAGRELSRGGTQGRSGGRCGGWTEIMRFGLSVKEGCQQSFHPGFPELKLWPVWDDRVPREAVLKGKGDQEGCKFSMNKMLQVQEHPQVLKDEMLGNQTSLDEQGDLTGNLDKKRPFTTFGRRGSHARGLQGCAGDQQGENQMGQSPART